MLRFRVGLPRSMFALGAALCALLAAPAARAGDNDLALWKLGHPDAITICTICDGSDNTISPGDPTAQTRFARMASSLGLAFVPGFGDQASTTGQAGFEIGYSQSLRFLSLNNNEWATDGSQATVAPPGALALSTLTVRKGIGGSFELGVFATYLAESQMLSLGAQVRAALIDGIDYAPDLSLRAYGMRVTGTRELDLTIAGGDVMISKSFGVAGAIKLQPYGQYGMVLINANTTVINFNPGAQDAANPTAQDDVFQDIHMLDNRYNRVAAGLRLVAGAAVVGLEANYAFGTNPVQYSPLSTPVNGSTTPPTQSTHMLGIDAHVGVQF